MAEQDSLEQRLAFARADLAGKPAEHDKAGVPAVDALLITQPVNVGYLTGFTGSSGHALVTANEAILITDSRYALRAQRECPRFSVVIATGGDGYVESLKSILDARPAVKTVGFEAAHVTVARHEKLREKLANVTLVGRKGPIEAARRIKDSGEVARIRRAIHVAEAAFLETRSEIRAGISERDLAIVLDFAMRRRGAEASAFETIVASGPQGAHPHHRPNARVLEEGDLVTIDFGALADGYCSDITRTVVIGDPTERQRQIHGIVLEAQRRAIAAIRPGKNGREIDAVAREYIASQGHGEAFGHSLGHALGRDVHDGPGLSISAEENILAPGMVLTVEPGIYIEGFGGVRIEEDVLVTEKGCEVLTSLPQGITLLDSP